MTSQPLNEKLTQEVLVLRVKESWLHELMVKLKVRIFCAALYNALNSISFQNIWIQNFNRGNLIMNILPKKTQKLSFWSYSILFFLGIMIVCRLYVMYVKYFS